MNGGAYQVRTLRRAISCALEACINAQLGTGLCRCKTAAAVSTVTAFVRVQGGQINPALKCDAFVLLMIYVKRAAEAARFVCVSSIQPITAPLRR
jgi:hypothetical protein